MSRAVADRFKLAGVASVAMLGSAVPVLVEQMTGQSLVSYGTWGASIGALMNVAGNVISGYLGNRVTSDADQARQKDDLLQNADWLKLTSLAVASLIREHGKDQTHYAGQLNALADRIEAQWLSLADTPEYEATLQSLDRQSAIRYFHSAAQLDPAQRRALDVDTWVALFRSVSETGKPILTTEDQPHLDEDRLRRLASVIHEQFSTAVYRLLKNPEFGGKACVGLILTMLGQTHEAVCLKLPQMVEDLRSQNQETRASLQQWGTRLQEEYQRLRAVADAPAHPRFDRYFQDQEDHWQVAYENFNALHQQGAAHLAQGDQILAVLDGLQQIVVPAAPVAPTRISNLHQHVNERRLFVGREEILTLLRESLLNAPSAAITQSQAIHAAGGVGKTQLAIEYAERNAGDYDIVWWVRAATRSTAVSDLASLAEPLGVIAPGTVVADIEQLALATLGTLHQRKRWLLIYDNAESPQDLEHLLPGGSGHLLLTTRNPNWGQLAHPFPLDLLTIDEAKQLLRERSGMSDPTAEEQIARRLGRLPLAIQIAGAYCAETGMPLAEYVPLLERAGVRLLDQHTPFDYHAMLSKTWLPSFERACAECPDAAGILQLLACVAPDNFPVERLEPLVEGDVLKLNAALAALRRYSLIERSGAMVSVHRLLQDVLRAGWNAEERAGWFTMAVTLLTAALPGNIQTNLSSWPVCEQLLPHGIALMELGGENPVVAETLARLLSVLGIYQHIRAQHQTAEPLMRRALAIDEQTFGTDHPNVATRLNNLAQLLAATNRLGEAEPLMRRALAIDEQSFGADHPKIAIRLNNLAGLLQATNRLGEAEPLMRRALAIDEQSFGTDHPNVAIDLNNLALLLQATNRLGEAEPLMRRHLEIFCRFTQATGHRHPHLMSAINNYWGLLEAMRVPEAERYQRLLAAGVNPEWHSEG